MLDGVMNFSPVDSPDVDEVLLERVVTGGQSVVWNGCRKMMNMVVPNVRSEPVKNTGKLQIAGSLDGGPKVIGVGGVFGIGVFEVVLSRKKDNSQSTGKG